MSDDDDILLPYDDDSYDPRAPQKPGQQLLGLEFAYIGQALTVAEFAAYTQVYAFGTVPPDFVVFHHTAVPTLPQWTAGESGLGETAIKAKRLKRLGGLRDYYEGLGWSAGPHLFIDDRWIYLFTPMYQVGVHAKWGNAFRAMGRLHYSIGIEVIGNYEKQFWPASVAHNVAGAVQALQRRLHTFDLTYLYAPPASKPGMVGTGTAQRCAHPERLRYGGIASHRDFNKPACPGAAITEQYYIGVLNAGETSHAPPPPLVSIATYKVKKSVTAGATVRAGPHKDSAVMRRLKAGDSWEGEQIHGDTVTIAGFGSSDVWIRSSGMQCVWSGLLEKVQ